MATAVTIQGHELKQGETAFAFLVLRLVAPLARGPLAELIRHLAPVVPDAEGFIEGLPEELEAPMRMLGVPWGPPEDAAEMATQRSVIAAASGLGVEAMWFFQTGTGLPLRPDDEDDDEDDEDDEDDDERAMMRRGRL